jgi:zinc protease
MQRARNRATSAIAALGMVGACLAGLGGAARGLPVRVTPPRLEVQSHELANGLQVLLLEDHTVPLTSVQVWYHVGSKDEKVGRSGFAHLFEHLMFKGSAHIGADQHTHLIESIGGQDNASTDWDRTFFFEVIPSNYLERILWMEADRMQTLDVSEENFRAEREVVKEERRVGVDDPPFGRLTELVFSTAYTRHPYQLATIGSMVDLDAANLADVRAFYRTYYVPNNATLVIVGDVDPVRTMRWVESYFGAIPRGAAISRLATPEPPQTAERRQVVYDSKAPLPAIVLSFHVPAAKSPDIYALQVASHILSAGKSSRLYRKLVYEKQIAVESSGDSFDLEDPGIFYFFAILQQGQKAEQGEAALQGEIDRLRDEPVAADELEKAKNQLVAGLVRERETAQAKASAIAAAAVIMGDVSLVNRQLDYLQKVTAADIQRVARLYFSAANRSTVYMLPEALRPGGASVGAAKPPDAPGSPTSPAAGLTP